MSDINPDVEATEKNSALELEATYLYRQMFTREPAAQLIGWYLLAHQEIPELSIISPAQQRTIDLIIERHLNANAIEPWLRSKHKRHSLSVKMLLINYLAESDARHHEFCPRAMTSRKRIAGIGFESIRAIFILLLGYIQKTKHGLL